MDFSKTSSINVDFKDRKSAPHWELRLFSEVILIDKTHSALHPMIYQLKDKTLPASEHFLDRRIDASTLPREAFILLGEAVMIDRKKKQILLTNKNTVAYNYLIIASGTWPVFTYHDEKFMAAFQALIEALRIKSKIPSSFAAVKPALLNTKAKSPIFAIQQSKTSPPSHTICTIAQPYICKSYIPRSSGPNLHAINKRLYEVHL